MSTVPSGSALNAAFTGAKTVNGPLPCKVSTRPAAFTAATRVVWSAELTAFSTMVFEGNIGWPPTITEAALAGSVANSVPASAQATRVFLIMASSFQGCQHLATRTTEPGQ